MVAPDRPRILVVEDETAQLEMLRYNLDREGFDVVACEDGDEALLLVREEVPDAVVLDWMLPGVSGIEVCRRLKSAPETRTIPVVMLTARGEEADRVRGLETGADDYVVKPYSVAELVARLRARLRPARPAAAGDKLAFADLELDPAEHRVTRSGRPLRMGPTEFRLLVIFMERPRRVWSRDMLMDRVWGRDGEVDQRTVDVHIGRLRKALNEGKLPDLIRTVRGAGYALDDAV